MTEYHSPIDQTRLAELKAAVDQGPMLILTHDSPDPDALASGMGLAALYKTAWHIPSDLLYTGLVARAENRALLNLLLPDWRQVDQLPDLRRYSAITLVDTQPGTGNHRLPPDVPPTIVIDHHHPRWDVLRQVKYVDVRPDVGATVSMVYQYLEAAGISPEVNLATAMFYGLQTDTRGLARDASPTDEIIYMRLLSLVDRNKLVRVEQAGLSRDYFRAINRGFEAARVYGRSVVVNMGQMHRPDMAAEMADVLIRLESARAVLCYGIFQNQLHLSLRTEPSGQDAGVLVQRVIGALGKAGGHGTMAGGQIPLVEREPADVIEGIESRFLAIMQENGGGIPLLAD